MKAILRALRGHKEQEQPVGPPGYWHPDAATIGRIRAAYLRTLESHVAETSHLWTANTGKQREIHEALVDGSDRLSSLLSDPLATNLYYGVDNMAADILRQIRPEHLGSMSIDVRNLLGQLSAALGTSRLPNPMGGTHIPAGGPDIETIESHLAAIDTVMPAPVDFPNPVRGEICTAPSTRGSINHRAVHAIYQAWRLHQCAPRGAATCLEIGGGTGRTAYYAAKFGLPSYTIVDLPMTSIGQACFLMATLGADKVSLFGEDDAGAVVRLRPPHWLFASGETFDAALNCDSLPEMSRAYAMRYVAFIQKNCGAFISINHEANDFTVRELWPGLMRFPYLMRPGYIEEFTAPGERAGS